MSNTMYVNILYRVQNQIIQNYLFEGVIDFQKLHKLHNIFRLGLTLLI